VLPHPQAITRIRTKAEFAQRDIDSQLRDFVRRILQPLNSPNVGKGGIGGVNPERLEQLARCEVRRELDFVESGARVCLVPRQS